MLLKMKELVTESHIPCNVFTDCCEGCCSCHHVTWKQEEAGSSSFVRKHKISIICLLQVFIGFLNTKYMYYIKYSSLFDMRWAIREAGLTSE